MSYAALGINHDTYSCLRAMAHMYVYSALYGYNQLVQCCYVMWIALPAHASKHWGWITGWQHASYVSIHYHENRQILRMSLYNSVHIYLTDWRSLHTPPVAFYVVPFAHCTLQLLYSRVYSTGISQSHVLYALEFTVHVRLCRTSTLITRVIVMCNVQTGRETLNDKSSCTFNTRHTGCTVCVYVCMYTYTYSKGRVASIHYIMSRNFQRHK